MTSEQPTEEKKQETEFERNQKYLQELKASNDAVEAELMRAEKLRSQKILGGKSEVVPTPPPKSREQIEQEEAAEYAKRIFGR